MEGKPSTLVASDPSAGDAGVPGHHPLSAAGSVGESRRAYDAQPGILTWAMVPMRTAIGRRCPWPHRRQHGQRRVAAPLPGRHVHRRATTTPSVSAWRALTAVMWHAASGTWTAHRMTRGRSAPARPSIVSRSGDSGGLMAVPPMWRDGGPWSPCGGRGETCW